MGPRVGVTFQPTLGSLPITRYGVPQVAAEDHVLDVGNPRKDLATKSVLDGHPSEGGHLGGMISGFADGHDQAVIRRMIWP